MSIDAVFADDATDAVVLVLVQAEPWDTDGRRLEELQSRLNEYVIFALDGQMLERFPAMAGRRIAISIEYTDKPGPNEQRFFDIVREQLGRDNIELRLTSLS